MLKSINQPIYKIIVICLVLLVLGAGVTTNKQACQVSWDTNSGKTSDSSYR